MKMLTKSDLLKAATRRYKEFSIDINGESMQCRIQSLTEKERTDYEAARELAKGAKKKEKLQDMKRRLIVLCLVDKEGNPLFGLNDTKQLENIDGRVTGILFDQCIDHVGFSEDDVEEMAKNSEPVHES